MARESEWTQVYADGTPEYGVYWYVRLAAIGTERFQNGLTLSGQFGNRKKAAAFADEVDAYMEAMIASLSTAESVKITLDDGKAKDLRTALDTLLSAEKAIFKSKFAGDNNNPYNVRDLIYAATSTFKRLLSPYLPETPRW